MSATRKSSRTPIATEKLKSSAGLKRAASNGGRKQAAFRAVNADDALDSEAASDVESVFLDDERK